MNRTPVEPHSGPQRTAFDAGLNSISGLRRIALTGSAQHTVIIAAVLAAVFILTSELRGLEPVLPAVIAGAFLLLALIATNRSWIVHITLIALFMTSVPEIPRGFRAGGVLIYFYELLIAGSLVYALWLARQNMGVLALLVRSIAGRLAIGFTFIVIGGISLAIIRGYPYWDIQYDARPIFEMILVLVTAAIIVAVNEWQRYVKTITFILIASAVLMVYASVTGFALWGRTEAAELYAAGGRVLAGGSTAVRYLTQTTPLALAGLLGCVALLMTGRLRAALIMPIFLASLVISILSFSRNTLLALAGTFICAAVVAMVNSQFGTLIFRLVSVPFVASLAAAVLFSVGSAVGAHDWIDRQTTGYANRVIAGVDETNERADTSAGYRETENDYIRRAAAEHPVFGGGFGTHYQPPSGKRGTYSALEGTMYSHNAYNWFYLKVGLVGLTVFISLIGACILSALIRKGQNILHFTAAVTLAGLSIAITVTPMPIEQPGSALLAILIGICIGALARSRVSSSAVQGV